MGPALREYRPFPYHVCDVQVIPEYQGSEVVLVQHLFHATHHASVCSRHLCILERCGDTGDRSRHRLPPWPSESSSAPRAGETLPREEAVITPFYK